ncbi:hypothetical protein FO440_20665 [Mucilaginibacter corticis]|uniref:Uncharacterized protein n=1 Tax=Mucilaginibacter corticis TaxID=2597670 RepID=A0A556MG89_9SPHI|nr:hypothetical protein [Mucilaginibacter corticis]TSJ38913.1 hypothetical protein FO440_20665 [Mucilaginibacter corticis]
MHEPFLLELTFRGQPYELPAAFQRFGYTFRIVVTIADNNYVFEPDEEGQYRVLAGPDGAKPDLDLLKVVAERLQKLA